MADINGINVVFVYASNMEKMRKFYEDLLGLKAGVESETWVEYNLPSGCNFALHKGDFSRLVEAEPEKTTVKFSFTTDNLDEIARKLEKNNVQCAIPVKQDVGFRLSEWFDPEGNLFRIIQY